MNTKLHQHFVQSDLRLRLAAMRVISEEGIVAWVPFSETDIQREPIKWLKYILLDRFGIEPLQKVTAQIHRFSTEELAQAREWTTDRFQSQADNGSSLMVVLKLVAWDKGAQLRNYRMFKLDDVCSTFSSLLKADLMPFAQIWCCESDVSGRGLNLGGRFTFAYGRTEHLLELVWFASPRLLESVRIPEFANPYCRALKNANRDDFEIVEEHVPPLHSESINREMMRSDVAHVVERIGWRMTAMQRLVTLLRQEGAREVCFCFKVTAGILSVIDWDSEIESAGT